MANYKPSDKLKKQWDEWIEVDDIIPFTNRVNTFLELYHRYSKIKFSFTHNIMGKKQKDNLLYEMKTLKGNMNNILPDFKYPEKRKKE